jgi:hypothetical protein
MFFCICDISKFKILIYDSIYAIINIHFIGGVQMKEIKFFEHSDGNSDLWNFLEELRIKSSKSKDCRVQYKQIIF